MYIGMVFFTICTIFVHLRPTVLGELVQCSVCPLNSSHFLRLRGS